MAQTEKTLSMDIAELLGDRFGRYSKYTIQSRAIPDARDGLKPVQRRILYSMFLAGNTPDKGYRKSAKTVGDVMGNYHPHGDSSIYEAMVNLAQPFKTNQPLIDGHGNWGSLDKDPAAAMRYTEARLSAYALELLADIKKETVNMVPNFDETTMEPTVLPARLPNLLINGATGIASGFATNIPPHNPKDVVDACIAYLKNDDISNEALIDIVKAPDFPTGCEVMDLEGIRTMYRTGSGSLMMSARLDIERPAKGNPLLVFSHIPYGAVKQNIVISIAEIALNKDIDGIIETRDETDRKHGPTGARIVVEVKKGLTEEQIQSIVSYLYKNTDLMMYYKANMTAIVSGSPEKMDLRKFIVSYIEHQREVIRKRTEFDLTRAKERFHIIEGYIKALNLLDEVIRIIRESKDRKDAVERLMEKIDLTEIQAGAIVDLRLYRLTNLEIDGFKKEWDDLRKVIAKLEGILGSSKLLDKVIQSELSDLVKPYSHERLSPIKAEVKQLTVDLTMTIPEEEVYVLLTKNGYIKRLSKRAYMGVERLDSIQLKLGDSVMETIVAKTTDSLLFFTTSGTYYTLLTYKIPEGKWKDEGAPLHTIIPIGTEETIVSMVPVSDFKTDASLCFVTSGGLIKKTALREYQTDRSVAVRALKLKEHDHLKQVFVSFDDERILAVTERGYVGLFNQSDVTQVGKNASGAKLLALIRNDSVVTAFSVPKDMPFHVVLFECHGTYRTVNSQRIPIKLRGDKATQVWKGLKSGERIIKGIPTQGGVQGAFVVNQHIQTFEIAMAAPTTLPVEYAPLELNATVSDVIIMPEK